MSKQIINFSRKDLEAFVSIWVDFSTQKMMIWVVDLIKLSVKSIISVVVWSVDTRHSLELRSETISVILSPFQCRVLIEHVMLMGIAADFNFPTVEIEQLYQWQISIPLISLYERGVWNYDKLRNLISIA